MTIPALPPNVIGWGEATMAAMVGRAPTFPIYAYGHSNTIYPAAWHTSGQHWLQLLKTELNTATPVTYGVGSQRILHVLFSLINETSNSGTASPVAGSEWPGTSSRTGIVVLDVVGNDIGHYPSMTASPVVPTQITSADTKYLDSMEGMYRAALAIMSSESRIEQTAGTFTGTWVNTALGFGSSSGGSFAQATAVGAAVEFSVTPATTGPLAGKVWAIVHRHSIEAVAAGMAPIEVRVDGTLQATHTMTAFERYVGISSVNVDSVYDAVPVTVPIDGAAHTVKFTHAGSAGQRFDVDFLPIPSISPNPILFNGHDHDPKTDAEGFDAAGVKAFLYNRPLVHARAQDVAAEFPNVIWCPSTVTPNGMYSQDGLHFNDRGNRQRAGDAAVALREILPRLRSRALQQEADGSFGII